MSRPPKPSAVKALEGNPGKRGINHAEPEPDLLLDLAPPPHLEDRSASVWNEIAPMLARMKVLTVADRLALEMLCDAVADYRFARDQRGDQFVVRSAKGSDMLNQWLVAQQMSCKRAEPFMAKFGMDPVARSRIIVDLQGDLFAHTSPAGEASPGRFFKH